MNLMIVGYIATFYLALTALERLPLRTISVPNG